MRTGCQRQKVPKVQRLSQIHDYTKFNLLGIYRLKHVLDGSKNLCILTGGTGLYAINKAGCSQSEYTWAFRKRERERERKKKKEKYYVKGQLRNNLDSQTPVAHACNPSYSGGRQQEDTDLKPA
jgi:hypothetical protein